MPRTISNAMFQQTTEGNFKTKSAYIFHGWWIVLISILGLTLSLGPVMVYSFGIFVKPLASSFSSNRGSISLAISVLNISAAICLPLYGYFIDRFGGRKVIMISLIGLAICLFGLSKVKPPLWHLLLLYALAGAVGAGSSPVSFSRVIANWFNRKRGLALGIATTGIGLGGLIMPLLSQFLIEKVDWRQSFFILGGICLLIAVPLVGFFMKDHPEDVGMLPDGTIKKISAEMSSNVLIDIPVNKALKTGTFWIICFIFFCVAVCGIGMLTHLSPLLTDRGISPGNAALATSLFGAATIIGRVINGSLIDKYFAPHVAAVTLTGAAIGMAIIWFGYNGTAIFVAIMLIGFALGGEADVTPFLLSRYFGIRTMGRLYGIIFGVYTIGVALGSYLFGIAFDTSGTYQLPLACAFVILLLTVIGTLMLKKYERIV
jgi:sugar phosphate permease